MRYYATLEGNPSITLADFSKYIRRAAEEGIRSSVRLSLDGMTFGIHFGECGFSFEWTEGGVLHQQHIEVRKERSNLIPGSFVYYFICPSCELKCRKLYFVGVGFLSRRAIDTHYYSQNRSHYQRTVYAREEPYRPYGKREYRGVLTPYGLKCLKYERWESRAELSLIQSIL